MASKFYRPEKMQVEVINRLHKLHQQGIHARPLDGLFDTKELGKMGALVAGLLRGPSEVEKSLIKERNKGVGRAPKKVRREPWSKARNHRQEGVPSASPGPRRGDLSVHQGADRPYPRNHHQNRGGKVILTGKSYTINPSKQYNA